MHVPASFHLTDALYGLTVGAIAAVVAILWVLALTRRSHTDEPRESLGAVPVAFAAIAGLLAMFLARAVRGGLVEDLSTSQAAAVGVVGVVAGFGWASMARVLAPVWMATLILLSAVGVWAAVPDTETAVAVLAAWLPFALWAAVSGRATPTTAASFALASIIAWYALAIVLAWAAAWGADAEPSSLPGAFACFGAALVVPWVVAAVRGVPRVNWLVPAQLVTVVIAARWAAAASTIGAGIVRSVALIGMLAAVVALSSRSTARGHPQPSGRTQHPR